MKTYNPVIGDKLVVRCEDGRPSVGAIVLEDGTPRFEPLDGEPDPFLWMFRPFRMATEAEVRAPEMRRAGRLGF